jgi:phage tail sheath protein FI
MNSAYKTPGVYTQEVSSVPLSVAQVSTAIPAFVGQTAAHSGTPPIIARGKSINAIRSFTGIGTLGAHRLDGNSNESRFVNVRRLLIKVELRMAS